MRSLFFVLLFAAGLSAQDSGSGNVPSNSPTPNPPAAAAAKPASPRTPNLTPPRSDSVNAQDLGNGSGDSSSKDAQIDLSPPADDDKAHPKSSDILANEGSTGDVGEMHPWDPHKAAKDIEVGDFYFKKKNYRAAEDRYREALYYKDNDALATYRLAVCLEKMDRPDEAREEFESYLRILPHGPQADDARKAIERLKASPTTKAAK